jgi:hypothetical protein
LRHERSLADLAELRRLLQDVLRVTVEGNVWVSDLMAGKSPSQEIGWHLFDQSKEQRRRLEVGLGQGGPEAVLGVWQRALGNLLRKDNTLSRYAENDARAAYKTMVSQTEELAEAASSIVGFLVPDLADERGGEEGARS